MDQDDAQIIKQAIATLWRYYPSQYRSLIEAGISELLGGNHVLAGGITQPTVNAADGRGDSVESSALSEVDDCLISEHEKNATTSPNPTNDRECVIDKHGTQGARQLAATDGKCVNTAVSVPEVAGDQTTARAQARWWFNKHGGR